MNKRIRINMQVTIIVLFLINRLTNVDFSIFICALLIGIHEKLEDISDKYE